jgi:hypothetical protein
MFLLTIFQKEMFVKTCNTRQIDDTMGHNSLYHPLPLTIPVASMLVVITGCKEVFSTLKPDGI